MIKAIKTIIRKSLQLFGFDIVPYRPEAAAVLPPQRRKVAAGEFDLEMYLQLFGEQAVREKAFYNIGAAGFYHPAWRNVDKLSDWYDGIQDREVLLGDPLERAHRGFGLTANAGGLAPLARLCHLW